MYRKILTASLLTLSTAALAEPYVGLGYHLGGARVERDSLKSPVVDGRTLDQSDYESASGLRALAGYSFNDKWALEFTFQQPTLETSVEEPVTGTGDDEEWESSIESTHFTLAPVYQHALTPRVKLRFTAGVLYGDYELEREHVLDVDDGPDQQLFRSKTSETEWGAVAGIGVAVQTPWKVEVLAEALHQRTKLLSNTGVAVSAVYRF